MKRGKDGEKIMGPMFPRLHVNDTNKGGPRAPPRNKMALYEQLSVPSQRYSHVVLPRNPSSNAATVPSSTQGVANERDVLLSYQPLMKHQSEKQYSQYSGISTTLTQAEQGKKADEDDFTVPIFVHSVPNPECSTQSSDQGRSKIAFKSCVNEPSEKSEEMGILGSSTMQEGKTQKQNNSKRSANGMVKAISLNPSALEKAEVLKNQTEFSAHDEPGDRPANDRLVTGDSAEPALYFEAQATSERHGAVVLGENVTASEKRNSSNLVAADPLQDQNIFHDLSSDAESCENGSCGLERGDSGVTETSGVDSISRPDITPDDVVGLIGQKHFWKARRAIANQQRVFAIQVFELHRLIKVQRLLAASPHLLLEDPAYLGKPTKALSRKNVPLDSHIKEIPIASKKKVESDKLRQKKESSAENTVGKPPFPSMQNEVSPPSCRPSSDNSPAPSTNNKPWCSGQPPNGQQWLIPIMSPTEGLIYKPYPVPGFGSPAYGGYGPPPNLAMGNFYPPAYGVPAPNPPYQLPPHPLSIPHGYSPQYGMPIMIPATFLGSSVEQMNAPSDRGNISTGNPNMVIMANQNNHGSSEVVSDLDVSKDTRVQVSNKGSPIDRMQDSRVRISMRGQNVLPLFPVSPAPDTPKGNPRPEKPIRVIKVVPHNAMSATESAARIFRSIQVERKQYNLM